MNAQSCIKTVVQGILKGGQTPIVREATTLLPVRRSSHQKPIKIKRQRTITQMREKGKTPENKLSDEEILSL